MAAGDPTQDQITNLLQVGAITPTQADQMLAKFGYSQAQASNQSSPDANFTPLASVLSGNSMLPQAPQAQNFTPLASVLSGNSMLPQAPQAQPQATPEQVAKAAALSDAFNSGQGGTMTPQQFGETGGQPQATPEQVSKADAMSKAFNDYKEMGGKLSPEQFQANRDANTHNAATRTSPDLTGKTDLYGKVIGPSAYGVRADPVANPMASGGGGGGGVAPATVAPQDPAALLKTMGQGASGPAKPSGPSAIDTYLKALHHETGEQVGANDREKEANLLASSSEQEKNAFLASGGVQAAHETGQAFETEMQRWTNAQAQARASRDKAYKEVQDLHDAKIDPQRAWTNASTGDKVRLTIASILGGFVQGWTGGKVSNVGLDTIHRLIQQDTDAQMKSLENKQSSLHDRMALDAAGFSQESADHATRANELIKRYALAKDALTSEASKYDNPQVQAAAEKANAELDKASSGLQVGQAMKFYEAQSAKERAQAAAAQQAAANAKAQRLAISTHAADFVKSGMPADEAIRSAIQVVMGVNTAPDKAFTSVDSYKTAAGKQPIPIQITNPHTGEKQTVIAPDQTVAKELMDQEAAFQSINGNIDQIQGLRTKHGGGWAALNPNGEANADTQAAQTAARNILWANLKFQKKDRYNEGEVAATNAQFGFGNKESADPTHYGNQVDTGLAQSREGLKRDWQAKLEAATGQSFAPPKMNKKSDKDADEAGFKAVK